MLHVGGGEAGTLWPRTPRSATAPRRRHSRRSASRPRDKAHTSRPLRALTARDLDERHGYLNVRNTLNTLFNFGNVVPIVNENDSTASEELRFGDNDTLAARVAAKINADLLIILSNIDGLYDKNPSTNSDAKLIAHVDNVTAEHEGLAEDTGVATSVGGMKTKLSAARILNTDV